MGYIQGADRNQVILMPEICNVYDEMMKPVAATNHIALQQRYEGLFFKEGGFFACRKKNAA